VPSPNKQNLPNAATATAHSVCRIREVDLSDIVKQLKSSLADPSQGLPEEVFLFVAGVTPMVNVDLLIRDDAGRTLLTWRDDGFYPPGWHIPGGIVRYKETMAGRVAAVAEIELGTTVDFQPEPLAVNEVIRPEWPVRAHFISFLYNCRLLAPPTESLQHKSGLPQAGQWAWHAGCPDRLLAVQEMYRPFL
jgi:ADP-ribose pyrophosphatase YjhB (NUDIX family)